jgi:glucose/arabinose dehydrogenase
VFAWGLRNPWRWSFDRATGDIYIGDVGQAAIEEIDYVPAGQLRGKDFGWDVCEGSQDHADAGGEPDEDADCVNVTGNRVRPVYEQVRSGGGGDSNWESVIGGQVYRGTCFPALDGLYFYSDYNAGGVWSFRIEAGQVAGAVEHPVTVPGGPTSIHADAYGELYMTFEGGQVHRIEAQ